MRPWATGIVKKGLRKGPKKEESFKGRDQERDIQTRRKKTIWV